MDEIEITGANQAFILFEFVYIGDTDQAGELAEPPVERESMAGSDLVDNQSLELTSVVSSGFRELENNCMHVNVLYNSIGDNFGLQCISFFRGISIIF